MPDGELVNVEVLTDCELLKRIIEGDQIAFEALWNRYWKLIYNACFAQRRNESDARDWTQEVFKKILGNPIRFLNATMVDKGNFKAYLYRVACHHCLDRMRAENRRIKTISIDDPSTNEQGDTVFLEVPDNQARSPEMAVIIDSIMRKLPPKEREVLYLRFEQDYTRADVAALWKVTVATVGNYERKAKVHFAELFRPFGNRQKDLKRHAH